jgi:hypothetical protein
MAIWCVIVLGLLFFCCEGEGSGLRVDASVLLMIVSKLMRKASGFLAWFLLVGVVAMEGTITNKRFYFWNRDAIGLLNRWTNRMKISSHGSLS